MHTAFIRNLEYPHLIPIYGLYNNHCECLDFTCIHKVVSEIKSNNHQIWLKKDNNYVSKGLKIPLSIHKCLALIIGC